MIEQVLVPPGTYQEGYLDLPEDPANLPPRIDAFEMEWRERMPFAQPLSERVTLRKETPANIVYQDYRERDPWVYVVLGMTATRDEKVIAVRKSSANTWRRG